MIISKKGKMENGEIREEGKVSKDRIVEKAEKLWMVIHGNVRKQYVGKIKCIEWGKWCRLYRYGKKCGAMGIPQLLVAPFELQPSS